MKLLGRRIVQNGYVVRNLDVAMRAWNRVTGMGPFFVNNSADHPSFEYRGVPSKACARTALSQAGNIQIELIQQTNDAPSVFREVMDVTGEGLHHVKVDFDNYENEHARLIADGFQLVMRGNIPGIVRFAFFDTLAMLGHFIEISETFGAAAGRDSRIAEICRNWDGRALVRDVASLTDAA